MKWLERFWGGCGHCHGAESCPLLQAHEDAPQFGEGSSLVGASLTVFILPLASAILGAHLAERWYAESAHVSALVCQVVGGGVGLLIGIALAKIIIACVRRPGRSSGGAQ